MASLFPMPDKKELDSEDLSYLCKLLETNLSLNDCFSLLENRKNRAVFAAIRAKLDEGEPIEAIISAYLPKKIRAYVVPLLKTLSFAEALSLSLEFAHKQESQNSLLLNSLAYPLILLFITISALYLFDLYGIDAIFALISTFESKMDLFTDIRILFRIVINVIYYLVLLMFILALVFTKPQRIVLLYIFMSKHFANSLVTIYYSQEFMALLLVCMQKGYKTRESLSILKAMHTKPVISFLAFHMDESLMEGDSFKEAAAREYYDSSLSRFIKIASYTNDFQGIIASYVQLAREKISRRMKSYTLTIQMSTYIFIGVIVIFIYQILFLPMQAISMY